eukprot:COSAG02_NODE_1149_length_14210_cov_40.850542_5_plen_76_part_00
MCSVITLDALSVITLSTQDCSSAATIQEASLCSFACTMLGISSEDPSVVSTPVFLQICDAVASAWVTLYCDRGQF